MPASMQSFSRCQSVRCSRDISGCRDVWVYYSNHANIQSACNPVLELHKFSLFTESSKYPRDRRAVMKFVAL